MNVDRVRLDWPNESPCRVGEPHDVEDQRDSTIAHDGGAGVDVETFDLRLQRLDDDFFGVLNGIDHQAELAVVRLQHDDQQIAFGFGWASGEVQLAIEKRQRKQICRAGDKRAP